MKIQIQRVDLAEVEENRLLHVHGSSSSGDWIMRVNNTAGGRVVHIWRDRDAEGLVGRVDGIILRDANRRDTLCEIGALQVGCHTSIPYFNYEIVDGSKRVLEPRDSWICPVTFIGMYLSSIKRKR